MTKDEALAWAELSSVDQAFERGSYAPDLDRDMNPQRFLVLVHRRAGEALAARVRELEGRTCDRCVEHRVGNGKGAPLWCDRLTTLARARYPVWCEDVKGTCGAFKEKTHAEDKA